MEQQQMVNPFDPHLLSLEVAVARRANEGGGDDHGYISFMILDTEAEECLAELQHAAAAALAVHEQQLRVQRDVDDGWEEGGTLIGLGDRIRPPGIMATERE